MTQTRRLLAAVLLIAGAPALAAGKIPLPKPKPAHAQVVAIIPIPRLRPMREAPSLPAEAPAAPPQSPTGQSWTASPAGWPEARIAEARMACGNILAGLDIGYQPLAALGSEGGCGAPAPILLARIAGVEVTPPATLTCPMAAALSDWLKTSVQPAARLRLGTQVTGIHAAASYVCRLRNSAATGKLSEHGKANALDMSGFSFAKAEAVAVGGGNWGDGLLKAIGMPANGSFLDDIRKGACTEFTTVLGPGSDPYHGDHLHVDVLQRKGGYRICQ